MPQYYINVKISCRLMKAKKTITYLSFNHITYILQVQLNAKQCIFQFNIIFHCKSTRSKMSCLVTKDMCIPGVMQKMYQLEWVINSIHAAVPCKMFNVSTVNMPFD